MKKVFADRVTQRRLVTEGVSVFVCRVGQRRKRRWKWLETVYDGAREQAPVLLSDAAYMRPHVEDDRLPGGDKSPLCHVGGLLGSLDLVAEATQGPLYQRYDSLPHTAVRPQGISDMA